MVASGMIIEAQYVVQDESARHGHEVLYAGERLSDRAPINVRTVGPHAPKGVRQQFSAIASILSRVDNENCLSTLATGQQVDGTLYLVTLAHEAGSLEALVGEGMPARELSEVGLQLLDGLAHLHAQGVVLGYVAPAGVTLGSLQARPRLQIVDYSMARFESSSQRPPASGPKEWLAPEVRAGQPSSFAADVYSTGLVLSSLAAPDLPMDLAALIKLLVHEDPRSRPTASEAYAGFAAFIDASSRPFDLGWLPPAGSNQLSSGVFGLLEESVTPEPEPTQVKLGIGTRRPDTLPAAVEFPESRRSRGIGIVLAMTGLLAAGVVAFVVTASPSKTDAKTEAVAAVGAAAAPRSPSDEPPAPLQPREAEAPALEGNPIVWLSQVNRQDLGAILPYRDRHRLLQELASREGVYEKVNQRWNAMLDLWQAGDTDRPCATFAAALASLDEPASTEVERDLLDRVVVPVPAAGSHAGIPPDDSCGGLSEAFADLMRVEESASDATPRRKRRASSARPARPPELPRKTAPPVAEKPRPARRDTGSVATKLDDDLRGF